MVPEDRTGGARALVVVALAALIAASAFATFRADDWENLERGQRALASDWTSLWTAHNQYGFYRPLVDLWHGVMMRLWGLTPWAHILPLVLLFALHATLLARVAAHRGARPALAWLVAAAAFTQVNTYAWTALWPANVTGGLMTTFLLLALFAHHRAVSRAAAGRGPRVSIAFAAIATAFALLSKEEAVLLPVILLWLEALRWRALAPAARRAAVASWLLVAVLAGAFVVFRLVLVPTVNAEGQYYSLRFGTNWFRNLAFFAAHLGALPVVALLASRVVYPAAWRSEARRGEEWARARDGMLAGFGWAAIGIQLFLLLGGRAYGYLYAPALGVALGVATALDWAARVQARTAPVAWPAARVLAVHWLLALIATSVALQAAGWPRYRAITHAAFEVMDRTLPDPPPGAHIVFIDPMKRESLSGRSLFNMVFANAPGSVVRLHYRRPDLTAELISGPAAQAAIDHPPVADAVFLAVEGRLTALPPGRR